jgi:NDP-sugar pyrophosphorylase family protein
MPDLSLLVLAAGIGKRYKGLKQVDSIGPGGEALLDYSLYGARREGFKHVAFVVRRQIQDVFHQSIGQYWEKHFAVSYVFQELDSGLPRGFAVPAGRKKPWGTGHALLISRVAISTPFAVINADDFYGLGGFAEMAGWLRGRPLHSPPRDEYCFMGYRLRNTLSGHGFVSRGVCRVDAHGFLKEVMERVRIEKEGEGARALDEKGRWVRFTGDEVVSMNFWGFTPAIFLHLEKGFAEFLERSGGNPEAEYFIPFAVNELICARKIRVKHIPTRDRWFGLTYPEDLPRVRSHVRELIREGAYPERIRREESAPC